MESDKYAPIRLRNQLCFPIYLCAKEITQKYKPMLERLDLTYTQYVVMMYFWEIERSTEKELSRTVRIDPSTLSPVIRKLTAKEYLKKSKDPDDERSNIIEITEKGMKLRDEALDIPSRMGCCVGLSEEEAVQLGTLISKVINNIERTN